MRSTPSLALASAVLALTACGGGGSDDDGTIDAPVTPTIDSPPGTPDAMVVIDADPLAPDAAPEFACLGVPIPGTADDPVTVAGDVAEIGLSGPTQLAGVTVEAYRVGNPTPIATTTSAATTGAYSLSVATGGTPADGYLLAQPGNTCGGQACKNVYLFPPTLIYRDIPMAPIRTVSNGNFNLIFTISQATPAVAGASSIAVVVTDCLGQPLQGATVTSNPAGEVRYNDAQGLPSNPQAATSTAADGIAYVLNVPTGNVTVDAMYMGMDLREHAFLTRAHDGASNAINTTTIQP